MMGRVIPLPPKMFMPLIPKVYAYVTLHGKKDIADVIKFKDPEMGRISCIIYVVIRPKLTT